MTAEFLFPLIYTGRRDVHLYGCNFTTSVNTVLKNAILVYLWVPIYALFIAGNWNTFAIYVQIIVYVAAFLVVYEIGYIITDNIGYLFEDPNIRREVFAARPPVWLLVSGICIRIVCLALLGILAYEWVTPNIVMIYATLLGMFIAHSFVKERYRIATFLGLRVLKGFAPFAFLVAGLPDYAKLFIFSGLLGSAVFYSIEYYLKKLGERVQIDIFSIRNYTIKLCIMIVLTVTAWTFTSMGAVHLGVFTSIIVLHHVLYIGLRFIKV